VKTLLKYRRFSYSELLQIVDEVSVLAFNFNDVNLVSQGFNEKPLLDFASLRDLSGICTVFHKFAIWIKTILF